MASSPVDCPGGKASCGDGGGDGGEGDGEGGKRPARRDARVALPSPDRSRGKWAVPHDDAHDDAHGCGAPWRAAVDELGRRRRGAGVAAEASKRVDAFRGAPTTARHKCPSTLCLDPSHASAHHGAVRPSPPPCPQVPSEVSLYYHAAPNVIEVRPACTCTERRPPPFPAPHQTRTWCAPRMQVLTTAPH